MYVSFNKNYLLNLNCHLMFPFIYKKKLFSKIFLIFFFSFILYCFKITYYSKKCIKKTILMNEIIIVNNFMILMVTAYFFFYRDCRFIC